MNGMKNFFKQGFGTKAMAAQYLLMIALGLIILLIMIMFISHTGQASSDTADKGIGIFEGIIR